MDEQKKSLFELYLKQLDLFHPWDAPSTPEGANALDKENQSSFEIPPRLPTRELILPYYARSTSESADAPEKKKAPLSKAPPRWPVLSTPERAVEPVRSLNPLFKAPPRRLASSTPEGADELDFQTETQPAVCENCTRYREKVSGVALITPS